MSDTKSTKVSRRKVLQGLGAGGVAAAFPAISSAACRHANNQNQMVLNRGVSIEFADAGASNVNAELVRVAISNITDKNIQLSNVSPGAINVDGKRYNLNQQLAHGPVDIKANSVRYMWLSPSNTNTSPKVQSNASGESVFVSVLRGGTKVTETHQANIVTV